MNKGVNTGTVLLFRMNVGMVLLFTENEIFEQKVRPPVHL